MPVDLNVDGPHLDLARSVGSDLRQRAPQIPADSFMLVGAECRNLWHAACGGDPDRLRTTKDVDLALATPTWETHVELAARFSRTSSSNGIQYTIAELPVDVMPFGDVEHPSGSVTPPTREEPLSVWGFQEVYDAAIPLADTGLLIATIPGYVALKSCAWLDRRENGNLKDAADLAVAVHWYLQVFDIDTLWRTAEPELIAQDLDHRRACAQLLGRHTRELLGPERTRELLTRWDAPSRHELSQHFAVTHDLAWPHSVTRRREVVEAYTEGLLLN